MDVPLKPLLVVVGLLLATTGMFVYRVALVGFGGLLGGAAGILLGIGIGGDVLVFIVAGLLGAGAGILAVRTAYKTALLGAGALTGVAGGMYAAGASLTDPATLLDPLLAVGLVAGLAVAWFLEAAIVLLVSAAWGAVLVAIALAPPIADVTDVQAVVDAILTPTLAIVFLGGIATQVGLWVALRYYDDEERDRDKGGLLG